MKTSDHFFLLGTVCIAVAALIYSVLSLSSPKTLGQQQNKTPHPHQQQAQQAHHPQDLLNIVSNQNPEVAAERVAQDLSPEHLRQDPLLVMIEDAVSKR